MKNFDELLTANQVAAILNCHVTQVYKMIRRGQLPQMIKFGERMSRMSRIELEKYIKRSVKAEKEQIFSGRKKPYKRKMIFLMLLPSVVR